MKYEYIRLYFRIATYHTARKISSHFPQFGSDWFALPTQFAHPILTMRRSAQTFARGKTIAVLREGVRLRPGDLGAGNRNIGIFSAELCARTRRGAALRSEVCGSLARHTNCGKVLAPLRPPASPPSFSRELRITSGSSSSATSK